MVLVNILVPLAAVPIENISEIFKVNGIYHWSVLSRLYTFGTFIEALSQLGRIWWELQTPEFDIRSVFLTLAIWQVLKMLYFEQKNFY